MFAADVLVIHIYTVHVDDLTKVTLTIIFKAVYLYCDLFWWLSSSIWGTAQLNIEISLFNKRDPMCVLQDAGSCCVALIVPNKRIQHEHRCRRDSVESGEVEKTLQDSKPKRKQRQLISLFTGLHPP